MPTSPRFLPLLAAICSLVILPASIGNAANLDSSGATGTDQPLVSELAGGWHLVRTHNPNGGADAISIMHPADTSRSDVDFVGLMIRCSETSAEVVIIVLPALPFGSRPHVSFGKPGSEVQFDATIAPPGTAVLLPKDAVNFVSGPWRTLQDLFVRIDDHQSTIRGVIKLAGLQAAFEQLQASCAAH